MYYNDSIWNGASRFELMKEKGMFTMKNQRLQMALDDLQEAAVKALQDVVRIDSTTGKEQMAQAYMEQLMKSLNMDVDVWCPTDDELSQMDQYGVCGASDLGERPNVVGTARGSGGGRSLILNGHIDTVPVNNPSAWIYPPYSAEIADGKMYGRGTSDMKSGLLAAVFAYKAICDAGIRLKGDVYIESVICEELGGAGSLACFQRNYYADGAIIMEPTDNTVTTAETGTMLMRVTIDGMPAHGSAPYAGVSAIEKWSFLLGKLNEWDHKRHEESPDSFDPRFRRYKMVAPICFGKVHAGNWCAMLPSELVAEGRLGFMLHETVESARDDFEKLLLQISKEDDWLRAHPPRVEWFPISWDAYDLEADHPLPLIMQKVCAEFQIEDQLGGIPYGTDIKYFKHTNIPTVLFGPGTITKAHYDNEYCFVSEYLKAIEVLAETIVRWCGVEE